MTAEEAPAWRAVLPRQRLLPDRAVAVVVDGHPVVLFEHDGKVHALGGICPHDQAGLDGAVIREGQLVCPRHGACFELATGACAGFDLPPLARYPARLRDGWTEVDAGAVAREPPLPVLRARWDLTGSSESEPAPDPRKQR